MLPGLVARPEQYRWSSAHTSIQGKLKSPEKNGIRRAGRMARATELMKPQSLSEQNVQTPEGVGYKLLVAHTLQPTHRSIG